MSVRTGREFLSIPGPTNIPDSVLNAMHQPAIDIYQKDFPALTDSLLAGLKTLFDTDGETFIYIANGHGAWEAALSNVLSRGDKVLVLSSGRFADGWGETGVPLGLDVEVLPGSWRHSVRPDAVAARLKDDPDGLIKAILMVQVDTASSLVNDVEAVSKAIRSTGHPALFMVDTIASLGTMPFSMKDWHIDVAVGAAQKGLMSPPGLSFNAASPRALARHKEAGLRTAYWDWTARLGPIHYQKYCGTPPEHLLFALAKSLELLSNEGIEAASLRHSLLAGATSAAVARWAEGGVLQFNVTAPEDRATAVTTVLFEQGHTPDALLDYCNEKCGVVVGIGIDDLRGKAMRIAHMGFVNAPMLLGTLGVIEMGLKALNIPHGPGGTQAAIDFLAHHVPPSPAPASNEGT
ncbi:pyridoxal-phosphate-dependent aminotransferase family protein [Sneathiella chinensis]|uniref:Aminotransferase n=1 Tax=Sneathiella chinensis TaxID=349750 RepID=A0ABQ5U083_9PROT|nr:aminotransferase class V-fold PLP-dependent enzyme [Sneathiella chinensis]GLQ05527.1 aminotransferase [Sneathiella chinensis]